MAAARGAASLAAMLYVAAILSLAGTPAPRSTQPLAVAAGRAIVDAAVAIATVDLNAEIERKLVELRPAPAPILRR